MSNSKTQSEICLYALTSEEKKQLQQYIITEKCDRIITRDDEHVRKIIPDGKILSRSSSLASIVIGDSRQHHLSIALAESCTGGLIAARLSAIPHASEVFWGSITSYQYAAKQKLLEVPAEVNPCSLSMAEYMHNGLKAHTRSDILLGVTGELNDPQRVYMVLSVGRTQQEAVYIQLASSRKNAQWIVSTIALMLIRLMIHTVRISNWEGKDFSVKVLTCFEERMYIKN